MAFGESTLGEGRIIAGYPHPETPGMEGGYLFLANAIFHVTTTTPKKPGRWNTGLTHVSSPTSEIEVGKALDAAIIYNKRLIRAPVEDLIKFGIRNLLWAPREGVPWCYIVHQSSPAYLVERLDAYSDEIGRMLVDSRQLLIEISSKANNLAELKGRSSEAAARADEARRTVDFLKAYACQVVGRMEVEFFPQEESVFTDWVLDCKKALLYYKLAAFLRDLDKDPELIRSVENKSRNLRTEIIGSWRWAQSSERYRQVFLPLDNTAYDLVNLTFTLRDALINLNHSIYIAHS